MGKNKNVLIVNFNTQNLTDACIKSVNKHTNGCKIYVFDNSDKEPFINTFDNVHVINNTKGEIVNFDSILERYENRFQSGGHVNNFGSFKHCISVDACFDLIPDGFILLDSDVLVKTDLSPLYDESYISIGSVEKMTHFKKRFAPYVTYINTAMCKENGIRFFNENRMFGFKASKEAEDYDTGCWFFEAIIPFRKKSINYKNYVVHFRAGSWLEDAISKHKYKTMSPEKWLNLNKTYWSDTIKKEPKETPKQETNKKPAKRPIKPHTQTSGFTPTVGGIKVALIRR